MKWLIGVALALLGGGASWFFHKRKLRKAKASGHNEAVGEIRARVDERDKVLKRMDSSLEKAADLKKKEVQRQLAKDLEKAPTKAEVRKAMEDEGLL